MTRSALENKYYKERTTETKSLYHKQRNCCSRLYKKNKEKTLRKLDLKNITDNKIYWKTIKPFLSDKGSKGSKITLVYDKKKLYPMTKKCRKH